MYDVCMYIYMWTCIMYGTTHRYLCSWLTSINHDDKICTLFYFYIYIIRVFCQHPPTIDNLPSVYTVLPVPGYMWVPMYLYRLFLSDSNFFPFSWFFSFWIFDSVRKSWMYVMYVYIQYIHEASHTYMYTYINTSMYTCMYLYVCMCTCTYIYIHTFMCIDR